MTIFQNYQGKGLRIPSRTNLTRDIIYNSRLSTPAANNKTQNSSTKKKCNFDRQVCLSHKQIRHTFLRKPHHEPTGVSIAKRSLSLVPTKTPQWINRCIHHKKHVHHSLFYENPTLTTRLGDFDQQVYPSQKQIKNSFLSRPHQQGQDQN